MGGDIDARNDKKTTTFQEYSAHSQQREHQKTDTFLSNAGGPCFTRQQRKERHAGALKESKLLNFSSDALERDRTGLLIAVSETGK